jgi:hypothetical protein
MHLSDWDTVKRLILRLTSLLVSLFRGSLLLVHIAETRTWLTGADLFERLGVGLPTARDTSPFTPQISCHNNTILYNAPKRRSTKKLSYLFSTNFLSFAKHICLFKLFASKIPAPSTEEPKLVLLPVNHVALPKESQQVILTPITEVDGFTDIQDVPAVAQKEADQELFPRSVNVEFQRSTLMAGLG